ncbi:MAG: fibronectin type III domain-containing protein, partial [bacterium]
TPGTRYRFAVNATNNLGTSALSEQSEPILAPNVPDPPKITKVVMGTLSRASISITPPSDDGGAVITHYTVYAFPGDHKSTVLASELKSAQITTLTPGTRYRFAVNATNNLGTSALSEQSEPILAPNVPDPPKITKVVMGTL